MVDFSRIRRSVGNLLTVSPLQLVSGPPRRWSCSRAPGARHDPASVGPRQIDVQDDYQMRVYRRSLSFDEKRQFVSQGSESGFRSVGP